MTRPVKQAPSITDVTDRNQREVRDMLRDLINHPLLRGVAVTARIGTSPTKVPHPLGRVPLGYLVVDTEAPVVSVGKHTASALSLQADSDSLTKLWVF